MVACAAHAAFVKNKLINKNNGGLDMRTPETWIPPGVLKGIPGVPFHFHPGHSYISSNCVG